MLLGSRSRMSNGQHRFHPSNWSRRTALPRVRRNERSLSSLADTSSHLSAVTGQSRVRLLICSIVFGSARRRQGQGIPKPGLLFCFLVDRCCNLFGDELTAVPCSA